MGPLCHPRRESRRSHGVRATGYRARADRVHAVWLRRRTGPYPLSGAGPGDQRPRGVRALLPRANEHPRAARGVPALDLAVRALHQRLDRGGIGGAVHHRAGGVFPRLRTIRADASCRLRDLRDPERYAAPRRADRGDARDARGVTAAPGPRRRAPAASSRRARREPRSVAINGTSETATMMSVTSPKFCLTNGMLPKR